MKTWKKVASMLLAAAMTTSFAACGGAGGGNDDGGNSPSGNKQLAARYVDAISDAMEAKSVKLTGSLSVSAIEYYYAEGTTTVDTSLTVQDESETISVEIVISEDTDGYAMKMKAQMSMEDQYGSAESFSEMILKGQYLYSRSYDEPEAAAETLWIAQDLGMPVNIETIVEAELGVDWAVIEEMLGVQEIKDATAAAREALVNGFYTQLENGALVDNTLAIDMNFAPFINGWVEYINSVDATTKTLGTFVDEVFAKAGVPLTYAVLLDTISAFSEQTVPEAIDALDAMLVENGTSLQATLDAVLESELFEMVLTNAGVEADAIAQIKTLTVADIKAQFDGVTVHDMLNSILASADEEGSMGEDPWAQVLQLLMAAKDATLEDMGLELPKIPASFDDLTVGGSITFNDAGTAVTGISAGVNLEMRVEFDGTTGASGSAGLPGYGIAAFEVNVAFAEFSSSTVAISVPAADQIYME